MTHITRNMHMFFKFPKKSCKFSHLIAQLQAVNSSFISFISSILNPENLNPKNPDQPNHLKLHLRRYWILTYWSFSDDPDNHKKKMPQLLKEAKLGSIHQLIHIEAIIHLVRNLKP
jgi:hypothetical protein